MKEPEENELFEERAAIMEFDGGLPRWLAERAAEEIVWAKKVGDQEGRKRR